MPIGGVVYVNGRIARAEEAVVPVYDHGFLYGEGIYETLRTYNLVPFLYDRHVARLRASAARLKLDVPFDDGALLGWVNETVAAAGAMPGMPAIEEAYVRVLLTRGVGELTYDVRSTPAPTVVIIVKPLEEPPARVFTAGINVALVPIVRNHPESVNPVIKSNNLLNNALAMQEANRRGAEEGLMCNYRGELSECSQANFFLVRGGVAITPKSEAGLLEGITRGYLFDVGKEVGIDVREETLFPKDLEPPLIDEAFITSTTRELSPVTRIDGRPVGAGAPGTVTKRLLEGYRKRARELTQAAQTK